MARSRVPARITDQVSHNFGLEVTIERSPKPTINVSPNGDIKDGMRQNYFKGYREVIPPGEIGSSEGTDPMEPGPQRIDTVAHYEGEQNDPHLHNAHTALVDDEPSKVVNWQPYGKFQPRTAPMPRASQDDVCLAPDSINRSADPLMRDGNSGENLIDRDCFRKDLYGPNRAGVLHNSPAHPGFAAVQSKIQGEGYTAGEAGAILASKTRGASKAAHKANPRLNRVK